MDVAIDLIRRVVRGFYDVKAVIVMDALLIHHVLSEKDLLALMGGSLPARNLRAICAKLKEDHLIKEVGHRDDATREHRAYVQIHYYVHFTEAVDAIKWKIHSIENKLKQEMDAQHNPQDYICDVCKARYKTIDAAQLFNMELGVFECEVCKNPLREDDGPAPDDNAQDKMGELMVQLRPYIDALRKIDTLTIPENTFQNELQLAFPMPSEEEKAKELPTTDDLPVASSHFPAAAQPELKVNITTEAERSQQADAEAREKLRLKEENALPSWHVQTTVGQSFSSEGNVKSEQGAVKTEQEEGNVKTEESNADDLTAAYFEKLQQQQQPADDDDDDDDDEFEDVI